MVNKNIIDYTVDDEPQSTIEKELTPRQILVNVEKDPESYYLVQLDGRHQVSYKDKMDEPIHMHQHMKFIAVFTGETPVS